MSATAKVPVFLAVEDALRREGIVSVLSGDDSFRVVGAEENRALASAKIRDAQPEIVIVDLNRTGGPTIELVRRVRAESSIKILVIAGGGEKDTVEQVFDAGGDGYLLSSEAPERLLEAIREVCGGAKYLSSAIGGQGLRQRTLAKRAAGTKRARRGIDPFRLRNRLRAEAHAPGLDERDYEIMTMMAEGIRPLIDRMDELEGRVQEMEAGNAPVPDDPRAWLSAQLAETLGDARGSSKAHDIEARLPALIEEAVTRRFHQMAGRLQEEIEETHVRTLETFVRNMQAKLVQRVSVLESDMARQAETMRQLREYSQRTEDNLSRLIAGVDKLAQDLPRRLQAPAAEMEIAVEAPGPPEPVAAVTAPVKTKKPASDYKHVKIFWAAAAAMILIVVSIWGAARVSARRSRMAAMSGAGVAMPAPEPGNATHADSNAAPGTSDTRTRMLAAQEYADRKDYAMAEDVYKQVVKAEPKNVDALKALASVLYREEKIEESASILDKIPK